MPFRLAVRTLHTSAPCLQMDCGIPVRIVKTQRAREKPARAKHLRQDLERLNKTIDPTDLSATLEAHRESNRASVIKRVGTVTQDPETVRPSFIADQPPPAPWAIHQNREPAPKGNDKENRAKDALKVVVPNNHPDGDMMRDIRALMEREEESPQDIMHERMRHRLRRAFLKQHECSYNPQSKISNEKRRVYFDIVRRVLAVIRTEQRKKNKAGYVPLARTNILEYKGCYNGFGSARDLSPALDEPWARNPSKPRYTPMDRLNTEIETFADWMNLTETEQAVRKHVYEVLVGVIQKELPTCKYEMFGSQTTGLAMPTSDIDVRVWEDDPLETDEEHRGESEANVTTTQPTTEDEEDEAMNSFEALSEPKFTTDPKNGPDKNKPRLSHQDRLKQQLQRLTERLESHPDWTSVELQPSSYPLVNATHRSSGIIVQIVGNRQASLSINSISTAEQATIRYLSEYPTLKPLFLVIRSALHMRNLSDVWFGGVGAYTTFMMIVASIKHNKADSGTPSSAGQQLVDFLNFYSNLDTYSTALTIDPPTKLPKLPRPSEEDKVRRQSDKELAAKLRLTQINIYQPYLLALRDPANMNNDLGRRAFAFKDIQMTFKVLLRWLEEDLKDPARPYDRKPLLRIIVGRCDTHYDISRTKVELYGAKLAESGGKVMAENSQQGVPMTKSAKKKMKAKAKVKAKREAAKARHVQAEAEAEASQETKQEPAEEK